MAESTQDWDATPDLKSQTLSYCARGMRTLWDVVEVERTRIMLGTFMLMLGKGIELSLPLIFMALIDHGPVVAQEGLTKHFAQLVVLMLGFYLLLLVLRRFVQEPILLRAIIGLENYWPTIAHEKLLALSIGYHERENTGRKIAKVNKGVEKLVMILADLFWTLFPALFGLVLNVIVLFVLDWRLALLFVLPIIPAVWINLKAYEVFHPMWEEWERKKEESIGLFCQSIINVRTVQTYVSEARETKTHSVIRKRMETIDLTVSLRLQRYFFAMEVFLALSLIGTVVGGFYFVSHGWSTIGTIAFVMVTGNATLASLWSIVQVYTRLLRNVVAAERMQTLLNAPIDVANAAVGLVPKVDTPVLRLESVSLIHRGKDEPIFQDFTLTVEPGGMHALVGKSGSGKSTLASLLLRVCDPTSGRVTYGGYDVRDIDRDWYRRQFAYVPQDVEIFDGSIRDNIVYADPNVPEEYVEKAIAAACLREVVEDKERFPEGLQTAVGERGVRLSGGERQRVGIARAYVKLLAGARFLVLDEATSSLDSESEQVVQVFIERLQGERAITIIAIAHRLSTIRKAKTIYVLDAGKIVEVGSHEQLLRENGLYHKLVALQQLGELRE